MAFGLSTKGAQLHRERSIEFHEKLGFEVLIPGIPDLGLTRSPGEEPSRSDEDGETSQVPTDWASALGVDRNLRGRACIMEIKGGFPMLDLTEFEVEDSVSSPSRLPSPPPSTGDLGAVRICLASQNLASDYATLASPGVPFVTDPCSVKGERRRLQSGPTRTER